MRSWMKWMAPVLGLLKGLTLTQARAADTPPTTVTAKVTITVLDKSGKAVPQAHVRLFARMKPSPTAAGDAGQKHARPAPIAQGVTDDDGKVSFTNIAVGEYGVMAGVKGVGRGHAKVSVTNSSDVDVTVTLEPRKAPAPTTPPNDQ